MSRTLSPIRGTNRTDGSHLPSTLSDMSAAPPAHRARRPDGFAAGQTIAMLVILLLSLPFLPFVLVVVAVIRIRDRLASARAARQPATLTQPAAIQPPAV